MQNTFELEKFLRLNVNNPYKNLSSRYKLKDPLQINIKDVENISKISKYALFIKTTTCGFLISFVLNKEEFEIVLNKEFTILILHRKYNKMYYDLTLSKI